LGSSDVIKVQQPDRKS